MNSRIGVAFLTLFLVMIATPHASAQMQCGAEYTLAHGVLRAAGLPLVASERIESKLSEAQRRSLGVGSRSLEGAATQIESGLQLLESDAMQVVPLDLLRATRGALQGYRDCIRSASTAEPVTIRVIVSRFDFEGTNTPRRVSGARVRVNGEAAGVTAEDGTLEVTVAADRPLQVAADDGIGLAGSAEVTVPSGTTEDVNVVMGESLVAEPNQLTLDERRVDGILPDDFSNLTLRFIDEETTVPVDTVAAVVVQTERGFTTELTPWFTVNSAGQIAATDVEHVRNAFLEYAGTLSVHVSAYDQDGRHFSNTVRFEVGRHRLSGNLIAPSMSPGLELSRVRVLLRTADGREYRTLSDEYGSFDFDYVPDGVLHLEAALAIGKAEYEASAEVHVASDMANVRAPLYRNGTRVRTSGNSAGSMEALANEIDGPTVTQTITDTTDGDTGDLKPTVGEWFEIPQGTASMMVRIQVTTEETVARATRNPDPLEDRYVLGIRMTNGGIFQRAGNTRQLYKDGKTALPGTSQWIEYPIFTDYPYDLATLTANGPWKIRLEAAIYHCCNGDRLLQSSMKAELTYAGSCPVATAGISADAASTCPPTVKIVGLTPDDAPRTPYGDGTANNDGHVYSIPRPNAFNHYKRKYSAIIRKTPSDAVLTGDVTLYDASTDAQLTTVRVLGSALAPIPGTDLYYLPVTFDQPSVVSRVTSTPPPAHFIRYRFRIRAESNEQAAEAIAISDLNFRERALWRMPDLFNNRRYGGLHTNSSEGGEPGGDNWVSRGTYEWMERNQELLTRFNDISGEHGVELKHDGHGYGNGMDMFHFGQGPVTGGDPNGGDVYEALKRDALIAQDIAHSDATRRTNAVAAIGRLRHWVTASREGLDNLLALPEVLVIHYIVDGEGAARRRSSGVGPYPSPSGLLPGWGRDLLRTGKIVYGNGVIANTEEGNWANGHHAHMTYLDGHHNHIHITLDRCIVDRDMCSSGGGAGCSPVSVSSAPLSKTIDLGDGATLTAGATGDGPFHYRWYASRLDSNEEVEVAGADSATITVYPTETMIYRADVFNYCGSDQSAPAVVTVRPACALPSISSSSTERTILRGQTTTITAAATGAAPLSYQWYYGFPGDTALPVPGGDASTVTITPANTATYWVRVSNACGAAASTVTSVIVHEQCQPVAISNSPASQAIVAGEEVSLSVGATGTGPYTFQWFIGSSGDESSPIPYSDTTSIRRSPTADTDYWARVSNSCGIANSTTAHVTISSCVLPSIISQSSNVTIAAGQTATLSVTTGGTGAVSVSWRRADGVAVGTGPALPVMPVTTTTYIALVVGACGSVESNPITITVTPPAGCVSPTIRTEPVGSTVHSGQSVELHVQVDGSTPDIDWYTAADVFVGSGETISVVTWTTTSYHAIVGNACGTVRSVDATVTVACVRPSIVAQPSGSTIARGGSTTLTVGVANDPSAPTITWRTADGAIVGSGSTVTVSPATTTRYYATVSNACASVTTNEVTVIVSSICSPPSISAGPATVYVVQGYEAIVAVTATGPALSYQWYRGSSGNTSSPILHGTSSAYSFVPTLPGTSTYWVRVTSEGACSADSETFTVEVCAPVLIAEPPMSQKIASGATATLSVMLFLGEGVSPSYEWVLANGSPAGPNNTSDTFVTPPLTTTTEIYCRVTVGACTTTSEPAVIEICDLPPVVGGPTSMNIASGQNVHVTVPGLPALIDDIYTWYRGVPGDVASSVLVQGPAQTSFIDVTPATTTTYWAQVQRNGCTARTEGLVYNVCVPTITQQPVGGMLLSPAQPVTLSVTATEATEYRWYRGPRGDTTVEVGTGSSINVAPSSDSEYWVRVTGACGTPVNSVAVTVTVCQAPAITTQPTSVAIVRGSSATFGVNATGTNLTYQWYEGAAGVTTTPVGTHAALTVTPQNPTSYWVKVTGSCGSTSSNVANVSVCVTPVIATQPQSRSIFSGASTTLSVAATQPTGLGLTYQWYRGDGQPIAGATSQSYTTGPLTTEQSYFVRISSGACSIDSDTAILTICTLPEVIAGAADRQTTVGQAARLQLAPFSGATTCIWYRGASGERSFPISGQQTANYIDVYPATTTQYWAEVQMGSCISRTTTTTVNVCVPTFTQQPVGGMINAGQSRTLTAAADTAGVTYQWYAGASGITASPITGATSATLIATPASDTSYWVRATGSCGRTADSAAATVTVCRVPAITAQPAGASIVRGQSTTLAVTATGTSLSYQWYAGAVGVTTSPAGGNSPAITVTPQAPTSYWVKITGTCGTQNSIAAMVNVCDTPVVNTQPQSQSIFSGASATLSVAATQPTGLAMTYQWYRAGQPISGATSASYSTGPLTSDQSYFVRISSGACAIDSQTAVVSICILPEVIGGAADRQTKVGEGTRLQLSTPGGGTTFTWYVGASGVKSTPITGPQAANYVDVYPAATTQYWAEVQNGSCVSRTTATTVNVCVPTFTQQPASVTINSGQAATLTAAANTVGVTYQWYSGTSGNSGSPIGGATSATLSVSPASDTSYWVRATGSCGRTADSATATVTVCRVPVVTTQPSGASIVRGQSATLSASATGTNLSYQWYGVTPGGSPVAVGGNSAVLTVSPQVPTSYSVKVTGLCGVTNSSSAMVNVCDTPVIQVQPQGGSIFSGSSTTLSVSATQPTGLALTYQWYRGGQPIAGATSATLSTGALTSDQTYFVRIVSGACSIDSATATISICNLPEVVGGAADLQRAVGQTAHIQLGAFAGGTVFTWYRGPSGNKSFPISGQQTANYIDVWPTVTTQYWAEVQSGSCVSRTTTTTVNICVPTFTQQPGNVTINAGQATTLVASADTAGVTYQWYSGASGNTGSPIAGATGSSFSTSPSSTSTFWVRATGSCGRTTDSATATVTVCSPPVITAQPLSAPPTYRGYSSAIAVTASGTGLTYQWYVGDSGNTSNPLTGRTSSLLSMNYVQSTEKYWVRVSGSCGAVNSASAFISVYPQINSQLQGEEVLPGSTLTLSIGVMGSYLSFQWYQGESGDYSHPVGTNSSSFTTPPIYQETLYWVEVRSGTASVSSWTALFTPTY